MLHSNTGQGPDICSASLLQDCPRITPMPCHKWYCCVSAAWTSRQKPLHLHGLGITTHLHLPARHRTIVLYLTTAWSYFPRLVFSIYQCGWDYTAAGLAIQSKLSRLLTRSIAVKHGSETFGNFLEHHTRRESRSLAPALWVPAAQVCFCMRFWALQWVFQSAFSPPSLLLTCMHCVDSVLGSL